MAVLLQNLSIDQRIYISKVLAIPPKENFFEKKKKNFYKRRFSEDEDEGCEKNDKTVLFYLYDEISGTLRVPYKFAEKFIGHNYNRYYVWHPMINFSFTKELRDDQIRIYYQAWDHLQKSGCANLNIYTSAGKTVIAAKLSSELSHIVLILVTSTSLMVQWLNTFAEFTSARPYIVDGLFKGHPQTNVIICMTSRIHYIPKEWLGIVGTLIIDESHTHCSSSRVPALLSTTPKYIITCSATPIRDDGMEVMMEALSGTERIIKISKKPFNVYRCNTGFSDDIPLDYDGTPNWNKLVNKMCEDPERNQVIIDLVNLYFKDSKILILTLRKNHVLLLYEMISKLGIKCDYMTGNKKTYSDSNVLVGSIKKIGTGFDEKSACADFAGIRISKLILAATVNSKALLEQVAGRCFRADFPEIYNLVDDNYISEKHYNKAIKWYVSRNGTLFEFFTTKASLNRQNGIYPKVRNTDLSRLAYSQAKLFYKK